MAAAAGHSGPPSPPVGWQLVAFDECVSRDAPKRRPSVPQNRYKPVGRFPVVDQGARLVAGYTDDESAVYHDDLPLIVFGDHTRAFKFLDFPFATGADGTKLLRVNDDLLDSRFLYYALLHLPLTNRGYNRHFKHLREQILLVPIDRTEQRAIARILAAIQVAIELHDEILARIKELKSAVMAKLFREGPRGGPSTDTNIGPVPRTWTVRPIADLGKLVTGTTPSTYRAEYYSGSVPFIAPADIGDNRVVKHSVRTLSDAGRAVARALPPRAVLVVCIGATIGKVGMTWASTSCTNQQLNAIICNEDAYPEFVHYLMAWNADRVRGASTPSPVPLLSKSAFGQILVAVPQNMEDQIAIASTLSAIDDAMELTRSKRDRLRAVFSSVLHALMIGHLRVRRETLPDAT